MSRTYALLILALVCVLTPVLAQQQPTASPPDYRVQVFGYDVDESNQQIVVRFGVLNSGGAAEIPATVRLTDLRTGEVIASTRIRPLGGGGDSETELSLVFPLDTFEPGTARTLEVSVGIGEIEAEDAVDTISNNIAPITIQMPEGSGAPPQAEQPTAVPEGSTVIVVPLLNTEIDTSDPQQVAILGGIICSGAIMLFILVLILRLLFQRTPSFGTWQPPYATMPPLDPNSIYGRRQMWQPHALNNVVPQPCKMGSVLPRKLLLGMEGKYLSGWQVMAIRMTQYDMYGRVSRSQTLASRRNIRRLDRTRRRLEKLDAARVARRVRPVARALARQLKKKINKRSAMLPIALDVRLQGTHGEVRIVFELYECRQGQPVQLDYWEPEMTVLGKKIHDSYTYTIYGQTGGETFKNFRKRLSADIERVLVDFLRTGLVTSSAPAPELSPDTMANMQPVDPKAETGESRIIES